MARIALFLSVLLSSNHVSFTGVASAFHFPTTLADRAILNQNRRNVRDRGIISGSWFKKKSCAQASALENERRFRRTRLLGLFSGVSLLTACYSFGAALNPSPLSTVRLFLPSLIAVAFAVIRAMPVRVKTRPLGLSDGLEVCSALGPSGEDKGLGLFALRPMTKGTYLFDFEGEVLSEEDLYRRYDENSTFLVIPDYVSKLTGPWGIEEPIFIDASDPEKSNLARYMNDAPKDSIDCSTISRRQRWSFGPPSATKGRAIRYFLSRDVAKGEELSCDYNDRT